MAALDPTAGFVMDDDLLNFTLDDEDDDDQKPATKAPSPSSWESSDPISGQPDGDNHSRPFPEFVEEELEWLSNKDAFPAIDTCLDILSDHAGVISDHHSPVSVLDSNSSSSSSSNGNGGSVISCCLNLQVPITYPVRARSKRMRRRRSVGFAELPIQQSWWLGRVNVKNSKQEWAFAPKMTTAGNAIGRRCQHCQADKTPQWRAGPTGPKTLCNACGVRYKSGRLVPEYRPASSPTFSSKLHSNSHRKIMEMRRHKQVGVGGMLVNEACGYRGVG